MRHDALVVRRSRRARAVSKVSVGVSDDKGDAARCPRERPERTRLQAEIEFWEKLIESAESSGDRPEVIERMEQALALAAYRALELDECAGKHPGVDNPGWPWNLH